MVHESGAMKVLATAEPQAEGFSTLHGSKHSFSVRWHHQLETFVMSAIPQV